MKKNSDKFEELIEKACELYSKNKDKKENEINKRKNKNKKKK